MAEISGLQVFKYLPAAKKLPEANCKKCGFPTCMAFALKVAKAQSDIDLCPFASEELKNLLEQSLKKPQKEVYLGHTHKVLIGGENVLYRHDKTFINKCAIAVVLDISESDWQEKLEKIINFEITRISDTFKIDLIYIKGDFSKDCSNQTFEKLTKKLDALGFGWIIEEDLKEIQKIDETSLYETVEKLTFSRKKAIIQKDENFSSPVYLYFKKFQNDSSIDSKEQYLLDLTARASFYLCKYANMLIFEDFDEAMISTLMTLRQNIYTDPQKPLQVESKVYEFNSPDENALVFLTTNFALTYFAVANELEALNKPSYLVVTPSEGMSVLTAWSAEKFTAQIVAKTVKEAGLSKKIKNKRIIIPGLLGHMKKELQEAIEEFEIVVGPNEAYKLSDFVNKL